MINVAETAVHNIIYRALCLTVSRIHISSAEHEVLRYLSLFHSSNLKVFVSLCVCLCDCESVSVS